MTSTTNDVVFKVDLGSGNEIRYDPVAFDLGVDIDTTAKLSQATIDFTLGDGDTISWDTTLADTYKLDVSYKGDVYTITAESGSADALKFDDLLDTFKINVGHTGIGEDTKLVDSNLDDPLLTNDLVGPREAVVTVTDTYGNASDAMTALFNLDVVLQTKTTLPTDCRLIR